MPTQSTAPLTPLMVEAIKATAPGQVMAGGATRTGLVRRGLVHSQDSTETFGTLTEGGLLLRAKMLPAPAPAPALQDTMRTLAQRVEATPRLAEDPAKAAQINAWLERHDVQIGALTPGGRNRFSAAFDAAFSADWSDALWEDLEREGSTTETPSQTRAPLDVVAEAGTVELEPIRKRFHGMNLGQRRDRRKAQRKARQKTRARNR